MHMLRFGVTFGTQIRLPSPRTFRRTALEHANLFSILNVSLFVKHVDRVEQESVVFKEYTLAIAHNFELLPISSAARQTC